ncbi:MAG: type II toxin-antitoxin system HicB family antitoxin [Lachnospira sp.]|jgi:predicted RNase H-like HicB family nuclease|nr:type II toxin-antitoxin system HicB family antitoxin [Lachnospira sp.]
MKNVYPVIFTDEKECVLVEVPDFEIFTEGKDLSDAIEMARDAIEVKIVSMEDAKLDIPVPSDFKEIDIRKSEFFKDGKTIISLVDIDSTEYRRKVDTKTVRRNVALPSWLNYEAEHAGINVSRVLQEALMNTLNVSRSR